MKVMCEIAALDEITRILGFVPRKIKVSPGGILMKTKIGVATVALVIAAIISGCAHGGRDYDQNAVKSFQIGVTTKQQVFDALGAPASVTQIDNKTIWSYAYVASNAFSGTKMQAFTAMFDENGIMTSKTIHNSGAGTDGGGVDTGMTPTPK